MAVDVPLRRIALVREGRDLRWVLAGPVGWRCEEIESAIARSPARDRIEWRRVVSEDELARLYAGASLFLWPSYAEGYGLPPLEFVDASKIKAPLLAHWATQDGAFPIASVDALEEKLRAACTSTISRRTSPSSSPTAWTPSTR